MDVSELKKASWPIVRIARLTTWISGVSLSDVKESDERNLDGKKAIVKRFYDVTDEYDAATDWCIVVKFINELTKGTWTAVAIERTRPGPDIGTSYTDISISLAPSFDFFNNKGS